MLKELDVVVLLVNNKEIRKGNWRRGEVVSEWRLRRCRGWWRCGHRRRRMRKGERGFCWYIGGKAWLMGGECIEFGLPS